MAALVVSCTAVAQEPTDTIPIAAVASIAATNVLEAALVQAVTGLSERRIPDAIRALDDALAKEPKFHLAHLLKGDLLSALGGRPRAFADDDARLAPLAEEARARLKRYLDAPPADRVPNVIGVLGASHRHVIVADMTASRLHVFENRDGVPVQVADFYITSGKIEGNKQREGDQKTPLGVYYVTEIKPKQKLTDFYGNGAFPINYPNEWDQRNGKNGHGIWLHGVPSSTYSRPPRASDGCVVLANDDLDRLAQWVKPGVTPVITTERIQWLEPMEWFLRRESLLQTLDAWKDDWQSRDVERYLAHYSAAFSSEGRALAEWSAQKRRVNSGKTFVKVGLSDVSVFFYPGENSLAMVTFQQDYASNNLNHSMKKRQYWQFEEGRWRVVYEAAA